LAYGSRKPSFSYEGISITACTDIQQLVVIYARSHQITPLADSLNKPFEPLLQSIRHYQALLDSSGFKEMKVSSTLADLTNKPLIEKLYQLGFLQQKNKISPAELTMAVRQAQKGFDLLADAKIRSTCIAQLNVPLATRLLQCRQAVNDMRWLRCLAGHEETILVNIPSAYMHVYNSGSSVLEMKMVVGKPSTPTPVFSSRIEQVILYPYWHVPHSIATKELLPLIKLSPAFIDKGGYQVLNAQGKIMDPYRINWKALGPGNFPYLIRQSTGCDNALGLLKLEFYTPFGVYLHDTPSKNAFNLNKRYFSHGCMRMEKPMELGRLILQENTIAIDTLTAQGCLLNQSPIPVTALHKMALVVWYNVAAIDPSGKLVFYEDVYKKFRQP
jgi:L,D-transpeptidase YcbB